MLTRQFSSLPKLNTLKVPNKTLPLVSECSPRILSTTAKLELNRISERTEFLHKKLIGNDLVAVLKRNRKKQNSSRDQGPPLIKNERMEQKEKEELIREASHNSRSFEDNLKQANAEVSQRLDERKAQRKALRIEVFELKRGIIAKKQALADCRASVHDFHREKLKLNQRTNDEVTHYTQRKVTMKNELDAKVFSMNHDIELMKDHKRSIRCRISVLDTEIKTDKKTLKSIRSAQVRHFKNVLKEGKDSRTDGLAWVICCLWDLGERLVAADFPSFLDAESVAALLRIAEMQQEQARLSHDMARTEVPLVNRPLPSSSALLKSVRQRLLHITQKASSHGAETERSYSTESRSVFNQAIAARKRINELDQMIKVVKEQEVCRVTTECTIHNYEQRYKTPLNEMVSAVIGLDATQRNKAMMNRVKNNLEKQIISTRTFTFSNSHFQPV